MEDIIDIIVTETTNLIEITSQPTDEIIDVNIIDNREDVTLNVTPTVVEININSLTGNFGVNWGDIAGTLSDQTDLQNVLNLKADLVDGKVPSSQLPSYVDDVIEVATYSALPTTGETGKIYVVLDTNLIYRWSGSAYIEIKDSSAVWGAITGTLSSQTDLQNALDAKVPYTGATANVNLGEYGVTAGYVALDTTPTSTPTGIGTIYWDSANRTANLIDGDGDTTLQIGQEERVLIHNGTGATLTDGQIVYVTGSTGELPSVSLADASLETTSAATLGMVTETIAHGANGFVTLSGIVHGLNTLAFNEGDLLWLSETAGEYTNVKPISPAHLVLIGYVIKKAGGNGSIFVKIQNTQELAESSDVLFTSLTNNDGLFYESSTSLWKNKSIATVLGYSPEQPLTFASPLIRTTNAISIQVANGSQNGYLSSADWTTFNAKQAALSGTGFVKISGTTISYDNSTYLTTSAAASTYLPLTGGTLTGNLLGTNITISNSLIAKGGTFNGGASSSGIITMDGLGSDLLMNRADSSNGALITLLTNAGEMWSLGMRSLGNDNFYIYNSSLLANAVTINSTNSAVTLTGALSGTSATFNGKVLTTASGNDTFGFQMYKSGTTTTLAGFYQNTTGDGLIAAYNSAGTQNVQIATNGVSYFNGGNVGIGTTSPSQMLHVKSSGNYGGIIADNSSSTGGGYLAARQNGTQIGIIGVSGAVLGTTASDMALFSETGKEIQFMPNGTGTIAGRFTTNGSFFVNKSSGSSKFGVAGLPTSPTGLSVGDVYHLNGVLMIVY